MSGHDLLPVSGARVARSFTRRGYSRQTEVFRPEIEFSVEFYEKVLPQQGQELIFYHQDYDGDNGSPFHLPLIDKLNDGDPYMIQPHYIDKKQAGFLLKHLNEPDNDYLKHELTSFRSLLEKVVNDEIILGIKNNNY